MAAAVGGVGVAGEQAAGLELVDHRYSVAGIDADQVAELLLGHGTELIQGDQRAVVMRRLGVAFHDTDEA